MKRWNRCGDLTCENARVPRCCENQIGDEALGFLAAELYAQASQNAREDFCGVNGMAFVSGNDHPSNIVCPCCNCGNIGNGELESQQRHRNNCCACFCRCCCRCRCRNN